MILLGRNTCSMATGADPLSTLGSQHKNTCSMATGAATCASSHDLVGLSALKNGRPLRRPLHRGARSVDRARRAAAGPRAWGSQASPPAVCSRVPPATSASHAPLLGIALPSEVCCALLTCAVPHAGHTRNGEPGKRCGPAVRQAFARKQVDPRVRSPHAGCRDQWPRQLRDNADDDRLIHPLLDWIRSVDNVGAQKHAGRRAATPCDSAAICHAAR